MNGWLKNVAVMREPSSSSTTTFVERILPPRPIRTSREETMRPRMVCSVSTRSEAIETVSEKSVCLDG